jgi:hypothetical protein
MKLAGRAVAPLLAAGLAFAGCGGATKTVIVQGPPEPATSGTASTPSTASTRSTTGATSSAPAATGTKTSEGEPPTSVVQTEAFQTPTGNIGCMIVGGTARCDIVTRSWTLPPRPASCPPIVNFGQGLEVGSKGAGAFVCAGDTARDPSSARLSYRTASQVGPFLCVSHTSGMTCTNRSTGHGFQISVQRYRLF